MSGTEPKPAKKQEPDRMAYSRLVGSFLDEHAWNEEPTVAYWKGLFWVWKPDERRYSERSFDDMQSTMLSWLIQREIASDWKMAEALTHALAATVSVPVSRDMPCWLPPTPPTVSGHWLPLENVMVDPEALARGYRDYSSPHTPRWFSTTCLPYAYNPNADCPRFKEHLERTLEPASALKLQEFMGYWLVPDTRYHAALFLVGEAGTGKSSLAEIVRMLVGDVNCSSIPLESVTAKFALAQTYGKLLNISDEIGPLNKKTEHLLKWYISGSPMPFERKYMDPRPVRPTARLLVTTNVFPDFHDKTGGIWRRIHVIRMDRVVAKKDIDFAVTFKNELPGIFNWAIEGLKRLRENGSFTPNPDGQQLVEAQRAVHQPHKGFMQEWVAPEPGAFLGSAELYTAYVAYCTSEDMAPTLSKRELTMEVCRWHTGAQTKKKRVAGTEVRGIEGLRLTRPVPA